MRRIPALLVDSARAVAVRVIVSVATWILSAAVVAVVVTVPVRCAVVKFTAAAMLLLLARMAVRVAARGRAVSSGALTGSTQSSSLVARHVVCSLGWRGQSGHSSPPPRCLRPTLTNAGQSRTSSLAGIRYTSMRPHTLLSATRTIPPDDRATLLPSVLEPLLFPALVLVSDTVTLCHQAARSEHPSARSGYSFSLMTRDKLPPARALMPQRRLLSLLSCAHFRLLACCCRFLSAESPYPVYSKLSACTFLLILTIRSQSSRSLTILANSASSFTP